MTWTIPPPRAKDASKCDKTKWNCKDDYNTKLNNVTAMALPHDFEVGKNVTIGPNDDNLPQVMTIGPKR